MKLKLITSNCLRRNNVCSCAFAYNLVKNGTVLIYFFKHDGDLYNEYYTIYITSLVYSFVYLITFKNPHFYFHSTS